MENFFPAAISAKLLRADFPENITIFPKKAIVFYAECDTFSLKHLQERQSGEENDGNLRSDHPQRDGDPARRRLQSGSMARNPGDHRPRLRTHGEIRLQHLLGRHLQLDHARTGSRKTSIRLARPDHGPHGRTQLPRDPRDAERGETRLAGDRVSGGLPG